MSEIDFVGVVKVLRECEKLVRATRRLLTNVGVIIPHMGELEVSLRDRMAEVKAYAEAIEKDKNRPLIDGGSPAKVV